MPMVMDGPISMMRLMKIQHNGQLPTVQATVIILRARHLMIAPTKQEHRPWIELAVLMRMKTVIQTLMAFGRQKMVLMPSQMSRPNGRIMTRMVLAIIGQTILGRTVTHHGLAFSMAMLFHRMPAHCKLEPLGKVVW
jgi:hypothetical protein